MRPAIARFLPAAVLAATLLHSGPAASEPVSAYTEFDFEKGCVTIETNPMGGTWQCPGYGGYPVVFSEGDLRQTVFYGHLGTWYAAGAWASFGGFNHVGGTIEWRMAEAGGPPLAAIQRWFVADAASDSGEEKLQVLVISKVGQPGEGEACVVGYVDALANKDANVIARQVADEVAPGFACRRTEPQWHGVKGANAPAAFVGYTEESDPGTEEMPEE